MIARLQAKSDFTGAIIAVISPSPHQPAGGYTARLRQGRRKVAEERRQDSLLFISGHYIVMAMMPSIDFLICADIKKFSDEKLAFFCVTSLKKKQKH